MKTLVFSIKMSDDERKIVEDLQRGYSQDFRKMFNNMDLMEDGDFLSNLNITSTKQKEYLKKEVLSFYKKTVAAKEKIKERIEEFEDEPKLSPKDNKKLIKLRRSLKKNVCFGGKAEMRRLSKGIGDKKKWRESRLLPLAFHGETSRKGNRFFDFKQLSEGKILFKMEGTKVKIPLTFNPKKYKELKELEILSQDKAIPLTVRLSKSKLWLTYDESILHGTNVDIKAFYKTITNVKDKDERKALIAKHYREHENRLKIGKLDRYMGLDLNPDGIGYSITDKENNIISKGYFDLSGTGNVDVESNKRKYETSIVIKRIFDLIKHFKAHTLIVEQLDLEPGDHGSKTANRKINNVWNRTLINELIKRRCNETGTILIEINPCYSSFIGNLLHDEYDPIAASLEVTRRGINKFSKGGFYPEFDITRFINDPMYDEMKGCSTWKDLYSLFITAKRSYRRGLDKSRSVGYNIGSWKSRTKMITFPYYSML